MEAARPPGLRRRPRRGTVDRPLNARLVRVAAFVVAPALLAFLFSVSTTGVLQRPQLEPLFDETATATLATELSILYPSRVPGSPEAAEAAGWYTETISGLGLRTEVDIWRADLPDRGSIELRNIATVVPGRSEETTVVVARRDNGGSDETFGDNASGTAALIELARGFAPQENAPAPLPQRTLVLVSTDAGAYGGEGARRFVQESPLAENAEVVIVLDGIRGPGRPRLALAGGDSTSAARTLVSTASARIEEQAGRPPLLPSVATQLVDLGVPFAAGEQGVFLDEGVAAVTITTDDPGDPNVPVGDPPGELAVQRLGQMGRATEALIGSVDASVGAAFRTSDTLFLGDRAASGWTVRLTLIAAIAPFALGVLDLLARNRRRALPYGPALRGLRARLLLWLYAGLLLGVAALTGILPTGPDLPLPPATELVTDPPFAGLAALLVAFFVGWLVARRQLAVPIGPPSAEERLAGYTTALVWLGVVALAVALIRPYALVFVLPSLYAWLWLPLRSGGWARAALFLAGLLGPLLGLLVLGLELGLGPVDTPLYVAGLATVGYLPFSSAVLAAGWAAAASQLGALAFGRYTPYAGGAAAPPPGPARRAVGRTLRSTRARRYARAR
jgi:Peptidase family M28